MAALFQLLTSQDENLRKIALMQDGKLLEYYQEDPEAGGIVGSICLGRVERVLPDVKAAFVKIGLRQNGFLPLKEAESFHRASGNQSLMSGQDILVQIKKAPKGGKGAFLTRDIALPGEYILLMPCNRFVGLSKRIDNAQDCERGRKLGHAISQERFGVIIRYAALFASEQEVQAEAEALWKLWQELVTRSSFQKAPAMMYTEPGMTEILKRDYGNRHSINEDCSEDAWKNARINEQLKAALSRRVVLPGGGSLVIDEREALQTIDVNTGSTVKTETNASLAMEENLRAVPEIARQIRLRNLSGIILIDFIDMESDHERQTVQNALQEAVSDDRVKNVIHGFTRLGLMEMTRKRTGDSLRDLLTEPCSKCCETGRIMRG